ncbi:MAG: ubiquinol-cytochrome C chaperone [Alphaproteobacteria bacterium]|nr:ubiquinol-cytochrome C chaperone [Alphaproteobacteria bacterium]
MFARLFKRRPEPAQPLYGAIVAAARQPKLYAAWGVPDTVDGRFDALVLHLALVIERLHEADAAFSTELLETFCRDMDGNLRELGAGDLSVGKKVRRMAEAFYGRYDAYEAARDEQAMLAAVSRNVYASAAHPMAAELALYALAARQGLAQQATADLMAGKVVFP